MKFSGIPGLNRLDEWLSLDIPFEYNDFMYPGILDDPAEVRRRIRQYQKPERDRSHDTLHGPFLDITVHSDDSRIRKASDFRIRQACDAAMELQVRGVILHTNFIPNFYQPAYRKGWIDRNEAYFQSLLEDYPGLWIYMENMFDEEPDLLAALAGRMSGEHFAICLDLAHAHLSRTPVTEWLRVCNPYVAHYHINDNHGFFDEHLPVGDGTIPWADVLGKMRKDTSVLLEVSTMEKYKKSMAFLQKTADQ